MPFIRMAPVLVSAAIRRMPPWVLRARTVNALEVNLALDGQYGMLAVGGHDDEGGRGRCPAGG